MRFARYLTALVGALFAVLLLPTGPAQAADLCPSDESVLNSSKSDPPYQCAVHYWSDKKSISAWDTKSWSADTALGYEVESKCAYRSSGDVSWTWLGAGPSYTATFTNWADGTRHFGTGVIFTTGSVDGDQIKSDSNCANGDGKITNAIKKLATGITLDKVEGNGGNSGSTVTFSGTVSPSSASGYAVPVIAGEPITSNGQPVVGPIKDGKYTIAWKTPIVPTDVVLPVSIVYPGDTSQCPAAAKSCGWTGAGPTDPVMIRLKKSYSPMPVPDSTVSSSATASTSSAGVASGLTRSGALVEPVVPDGSVATASASGSASDASGLVIKQKTKRMPGKLGLQCSSGTTMLHAEIDRGSSSRVLSYGKRGVQLKRGAVADGRKATLQLTCRKNGGSTLHVERASFGTAKADRMSTRAKRSMMFGGPGADRLVVNRKGGQAHGGLGNDHLVVRAASGVASGGAGNDAINVRAAKRALVIGGPGRDRIVASGKVRVNLRDGQPDRVVCRGSKVRVLADSKDQLGRNCRSV